MASLNLHHISDRTSGAARKLLIRSRQIVASRRWSALERTVGSALRLAAVAEFGDILMS